MSQVKGNKFKLKWIYVITLFFTIQLINSQTILFDDYHAPHEPSVWQSWFDTLANYGVNVRFARDIGWQALLSDSMNIDTFSMFWLVFSDVRSLYDEDVELILNIARKVKTTLIWDGTTWDPPAHGLNFLLKYNAWKTTVYICGSYIPDHWKYTLYPLDFSPVNDNVAGRYFWGAHVSVFCCGENCYPLMYCEPMVLFDSLFTLPMAVLTFPFIEEGNCSSKVIIMGGTHHWETALYNYEGIWRSDWVIARDYLLSSANVSGYEIPDCTIPEIFQISISDIPPCATPGDTVRLYGRNLWRGTTKSMGGDIEIYIGATEMVPHDYDTIIIPIRYAPDSTWLEFIMPDLPPGTYPIRLGHKAITFYAGEITVPCPMHADIFPECADPGDVITISGENLVEPVRIVVGDSVVSAVSYSDDRSKVSFRCPWLPRGRYQVSLSWHDMFVASGMIEIPCPHRCERFPNPITPNFDAINDFAQFEFDGIFVKPARIHIFDIHGHEIQTIDVPAGLSAKQHARWDGTDDGGNPVPEGVYIYTIEVAGEIVCEGTVTVAR